MENRTLTVALALVGWASTFILSWLLLLGVVERDLSSLPFFVLYIAVAIAASAMLSPKEKK